MNRLIWIRIKLDWKQNQKEHDVKSKFISPYSIYGQYATSPFHHSIDLLNLEEVMGKLKRIASDLNIRFGKKLRLRIENFGWFLLLCLEHKSIDNFTRKCILRFSIEYPHSVGSTVIFFQRVLVWIFLLIFARI